MSPAPRRWSKKEQTRSGLGLALALDDASLDLGDFAGAIARGIVALVVDIPAMFLIVPAGLFAAYVLATIPVSCPGRNRVMVNTIGNL